MDTLLTWVVCAVGLCGAELAYWLPLKKRRNFTMRTALNFIAAVPLAQVIIWANSGHAKPAMLLVIYGGYFIWAAVSTHLCTLLDWSASAYCSIWIVLTTESAYELWRVLIWTAQTLGMRHLPLHSTPMLLGQLGFTIACCVTVRYTMARTMPEDGIYHIGPRQLGSAGDRKSVV